MSLHPQRRQVDVAALIADTLDARHSVSVTLARPSDWSAHDGPVAVIADDGGALYWPGAGRHQIRCTVWAQSRSTAVELSGDLFGDLLAGRIAGVGRRDPGAMPIVDFDDSDRAYFATFTVNVVARTRSA